MGKSLYPVLEFSNETGTPVNGSLVLQKGDNLTITCYSYLEVQWIVMQGEDSYVSLEEYWQDKKLKIWIMQPCLIFL